MAFEPPPMQATSAVGQPPLALEHLRPRLLADDRLEVAHHRRIGMRPGHRADAVEGVADVGHPVAQRLVHRVLQRAAAAGHRHHLGAEQLHAEDVRLLPLDVGRAHEDHAFQPEAGADRRGGDAVLAGAGLGDDPGLAHPPRQQDLPEHVVDLVRAGVVELVALEVDLRAAEPLGQPLGEVERRRAGRRSASRGRPSRPRSRRRSWPARTRPRGRGSAASASRRRSARRNRRSGRARRGRCGRSWACCSVHRPLPRNAAPSSAGRQRRPGKRAGAVSRASACGCAAASRRRTKARDPPGVLEAGGRLSTPGRDVDLLGAGQPHRLGDVLGGQPAGQHPGPRPAPPAEQPPVEGQRRCRRGVRAARRARVDQQLVGDPRVGVDLRQVGLDRDRRPPSSPAARSAPRTSATRSGGLAAVQLQHVERDGLDQPLELLVVGVDGQRDPDRSRPAPPRRPSARRRASGAAARAGRRPARRRRRPAAAAASTSARERRPQILTRTAALSSPRSASTSSSGWPDLLRSRSTSRLSRAASCAFCEARRRCLCSRSHSNR